MKLKLMSALLDSTTHHFWKAYAHVVSRNTPSVLPCDVVYIILRYVPSWQYLANLQLRGFTTRGRTPTWTSRVISGTTD